MADTSLYSSAELRKRSCRVITFTHQGPPGLGSRGCGTDPARTSTGRWLLAKNMTAWHRNWLTPVPRSPQRSRIFELYALSDPDDVVRRAHLRSAPRLKKAQVRPTTGATLVEMKQTPTGLLRAPRAVVPVRHSFRHGLPKAKNPKIAVELSDSAYRCRSMRIMATTG